MGTKTPLKPKLEAAENGHAKHGEDVSLVVSADGQNEISNAEYSDACNELLREIELFAGIRHPDIVSFFGACFDADRPPILVMEYMDNGDLERYYLKRRVETQAIFHAGLAQVLHWSTAVARALWYLHSREKPIIHRDIKPLNILLSTQLHAKLTDFGMSRAIPQKDDPSYCKMSGGVGSWLYMAPEVVRYQDYKEKADIYAFGLIMYFMSSGRDPFWDLASKEPDACLKEYLKGNEPRPNTRECPMGLRPVMERAWEVNALERSSASELLQLLTSVPEEQGFLQGIRCLRRFSR